MHIAAIRDRNTIGIGIDNIPAALFSVIGNMTVCYVLEDALMEIANIIIVGLVTLAEYLVADDFLP